MTVYQVSQKIGIRKRDIVGLFAKETTAQGVLATLDADTEPTITSVEIFEGEVEEWQASRDAAAREAVLSRLTEAERRLIGI